MSEIKLVKRIKYAGDVHAALMELGWDAKTAAAFLDDIPDADAVEVVRCKDCKRCRGFGGVTIEPNEVGICKVDGMCTKPHDFCSKGKRRTDK